MGPNTHEQCHVCLWGKKRMPACRQLTTHTHTHTHAHTQRHVYTHKQHRSLRKPERVYLIQCFHGQLVLQAGRQSILVLQNCIVIELLKDVGTLLPSASLPASRACNKMRPRFLAYVSHLVACQTAEAMVSYTLGCQATAESTSCLHAPRVCSCNLQVAGMWRANSIFQNAEQHSKCKEALCLGGGHSLQPCEQC